MDAKVLKSQLIVMGEPIAATEDYLETTNTPSIDGYWDYKHQEESAYNAQVRWDARAVKDPVMPKSRFV